MKSPYASGQLYFVLFLLFFTYALAIPSEAWSHQHDDYAEAERARERNEPVFVAPEIQALAAPGTQTFAVEGPLNQIGQWGPVVTWDFVFQGAANLPDGRILAWGANNRFRFSGGSSAFAAIWDPATGQIIERNHMSHPLFCGIPTMLEDGRLFVNGGDTNTKKVSTFDYRTNQWTLVESMNNGRWYPGSVALPNGKVLTMLGRPGGIYPEIWTEGQGWSIQTGTDLNDGILNFDGHRSTWLPHLHLKPDGEIFHSGPTQQMNSIDPSGNGSITSAGLSNSWYPNYSAGIMYDEGKLLVAGGAVNGVGSSPGTNQAMIIDFNSPAPTKTNIAPMSFARQFSNGVVLPTGEVLVMGGNTSGVVFSDLGTILTPETWNPDTQTWREMADMSVPRNYHSVALLMTDGRVWSGGGGLCNCSADHPDHQVYSPPYLFNADGSLATRPSISSAPNTVGPKDSILVQASSGIQRFSIIKMSSISHNLNSDLRSLKVPFTQTGAGEYELTMHTSANILTPGYWMLFAVDGQGVPSVAKVIQVLSAPQTGNQAPVVTNPGAQTHAEGDTINLPIDASDTDGDLLTYSSTGMPLGLSIDSSTGVIAGTVASGTVGTYSVTANVSDGLDSVSVTFPWTISMVPSDGVVLNATFDTGTDGFTYLDDAFRGTNNPEYASGRYLPRGGRTNGGLQVLVGGKNHADIVDMSGGWQHNFELTSPQQVQLAFWYKLIQTSEYESDEFSQALVQVDGTLYGELQSDHVAQITGNGNGGPTQTTGWEFFQVETPVLATGSHTLVLGAYNNKKTFRNERTKVKIDDVTVTTILAGNQ